MFLFDENIQYICQLLEKNNIITDIFLSEINEITNKSGKFFLSLLDKNKTINNIVLEDTKIIESMIKKIDNKILKNVI